MDELMARESRRSDSGEVGSNEAQPRRGPPNRMNDLDYSTWMKFQKSFFRYSGDQVMMEENIHFFTKAVWPDGRASSTLIIGFDSFDEKSITAPRIVDHFVVKSIDDVIVCLQSRIESGHTYDFIVIDIREILTDINTTFFLKEQARPLFDAMANLLIEGRYSGIVCQNEAGRSTGNPIPWYVASSSRGSLKLRDEKIALCEDSRLFYCHYMQKEKDSRETGHLLDLGIGIASTDIKIALWDLPKTPPRKKNEILHPAKFPEPLIASFIETFTKPGETVFDPMVGTGSTIVAALQTGRKGYGMDINQEFVDIAKKRVANNFKPRLDDWPPKYVPIVVRGDATKISQYPEVGNMKFNYVITSPPYWSMLHNPGSENQQTRRDKNLRLVYSDDEQDVGNIEDYDLFISTLEKIYSHVADHVVDGGYITIIVKNVKRDHTIYPLAWDLTACLTRSSSKLDYIGNTFWCQDNVGLKPFAVGTHWVSNVLHQYCLHFKKRLSHQIK